MIEKRNRPIGMFDSGIGGLTVLRAIREKLSKEQVVYLGDTARLPYGDKSSQTVLRYSIENSIFLMEHWIKLLVIACNTASSVAVDKLRQIFNIPVVGVIEPGAERAVALSKNEKIAVLGTRGTVQSGAYQAQILKLNPKAHVTSIACPLFVPLIEEGLHEHPSSALIIEEYLKPIKDSRVDTLLLGCTHYLAMEKPIRAYLGNEIRIIDSASSCADHVAQLLQNENLSTTSSSSPSPLFFASDNPEKFKHLGRKFLHEEIEEVKLCQNSALL